MSEFQYIAFRGIDGPVTKENFEFMRQQSSRAKITPRSFDSEYDHRDFGGDTAEMLRRGYDFHLHYANFGIRTLMNRLPNGLPSPKVSGEYLQEDGLSFSRDEGGPGGIPCIQPYIEARELDDRWDIGPILDRLLPLRAEILSGDLRPLYNAQIGRAHV